MRNCRSGALAANNRPGVGPPTITPHPMNTMTDFQKFCSDNRFSSNGGFTLLEVLVALTIFALVAGALLETFNGGLRNTRLAGEYAQAVVHARSKLVEVNARETFITGSESGRLGPVYDWRVEISDYRDGRTPSSAAPPVIPLEVVVEVFWGEAGTGRRSVRLQSLILGRISPDGA